MKKIYWIKFVYFSDIGNKEIAAIMYISVSCKLFFSDDIIFPY